MYEKLKPGALFLATICTEEDTVSYGLRGREGGNAGSGSISTIQVCPTNEMHVILSADI